MTAPIIATKYETHGFSVQLAQELGSVDAAIIVQFLINCISKHKLLDRHNHDGRTWNYCTKRELCAEFPYWTEKMIRTRFDQLIKAGVLLVSNHNQKKWDQTLWFAFADEARFGLDAIVPICPNGQMDLPKRADAFAQTGRPIPMTTTMTNSNVYGVNDTASPSVTSSTNEKRSLYKGKAKYSDEQRDTFEWLRGLNLDTSDDTLSWWARNYPLTRLDEVYRESVKRNPKSLGAYMQRLLKSQSVVVSGRIELNAEFATVFKELRSWRSLEIHQKYACINMGTHNIEIDFNMDPDDFKNYLIQKHETFEGRNG